MSSRYLILAALLAALGCQGDGDGRNPRTRADLESHRATVEVELLLNWFPEAEHGGYFAALVHGLYEQEGLHVTIKPGGPGVPVLSQVASGRAAFGISNAQNVLLGWPQEAHTVALMAPLQHSPRCIMVHEKSGIRRFDQLRNLTLAMNSSSTFSLFLQKKVPLNGVRIVPYSGNVAPFLLDENLAQQGYVFSEPLVARREGGDPYVLMVSDLGFDPYTSVLITRPDLIRDDPELVRKMVRASIRGWLRYLDDPEETNWHISRENDEMDLQILHDGAREIRSLCLDDETTAENFGRMTAERWATLHDQLVEVEALEAEAVDPRSAFTTDYLPSEEGT